MIRSLNPTGQSSRDRSNFGSRNPTLVQLWQEIQQLDQMISDAAENLREAAESRGSAQVAYDTCLSRYRCDAGCSGIVASPTAHQQVCGGCNQTYWSCYTPASRLHQQVTCSYERVTEWFNGGARTGGAYGCGATYWKCKDSSAHSVVRVGAYYSRVCLQSSSSGSSSSGGGSGGGSTPPATTPSTGSGSGSGSGSGLGSGSGSGSGGSDTRVRCGHSNCQRGGWASSRYAHKTTCPAGHRYYACSLGGTRRHANCRPRR